MNQKMVKSLNLINRLKKLLPKKKKKPNQKKTINLREPSAKAGKANYLIEFRVRGYAKKYAKAMIYDIGRKFHVRGVTKKKPVPHISLFGPFKTNKQGQAISEMVNVCKQYERIYFTFKGFNYFDNKTNKVIYLDVKPSEDLKNFRFDLAKSLLKVCVTKSKEDSKIPEDFKFHSTIAFKDIDNKFDKIWNYISKKKQKKIRQTLLRVTLLKNGKILKEYDFMQKRLLNRKESLNKGLWSKTIRILKNN
jgi:2'-5' RNA ligase